MISAGMFIFGYGWLFVTFKFESMRSKAFFRELFQSRQIHESKKANLF